MNLGELRTAVSSRIAVPTAGDALASNASIDACINAALRDISSEQSWPWLLTSSSPTFAYGVAVIPTGCGRIKTFAIDGLPVPQASLEDVLSGAKQWVWAEDGASIRLSPTPSSTPTATLWYYRVEPTLVLDADLPLLPVVHHQTLVARASYHLNVRRSDATRVAADLAEYERGLKNMMQSVHRGTSPKVIRSAYRDQATARWT